MQNNQLDFENIRYDGAKVAAEWIAELESSDSRLHKESVIEKALLASKLGSADAQCFLFNCYQAYNPYYVFGVRQVPETDGLENMPNPWTTFWALLESLRTRSITGHSARNRIQEVAEMFDSTEWNNVARRVLIKDLRCGISEKTLNKVLKNTQWKIPVFTCQLAQDSTDQPQKLKGSKRLEVKLDGVRVLAVVSNDGANLYSRNGKLFENFPQIAEYISVNYRQLRSVVGKVGNFVLDGEIVGDSFQKLMRQAHRKSDAETTGMVYHVFDIIPLSDFERGHWNAQQHKRIAILEEIQNKLDQTAPVQIMPGLMVDLDTAEGHDIMRRFAEDSVAKGYEGIMIKSNDAPYQCKRTDAWMKWKPTITVDLTIVGFEEGTGRNKNRLGALVCEGIDNGKKITVNVGSGFSDDNRTEFWNSRDSMSGHLVEVEADAVTQNQDGTYSLRFPRFLRFRDFDAGEKL